MCTACRRIDNNNNKKISLGIIHLQNAETSEFRKLLNIVKSIQIKKAVHTHTQINSGMHLKAHWKRVLTKIIIISEVYLCMHRTNNNNCHFGCSHKMWGCGKRKSQQDHERYQYCTSSHELSECAAIRVRRKKSPRPVWKLNLCKWKIILHVRWWNSKPISHTHTHIQPAKR